jgi:hypothetical protein
MAPCQHQYAAPLEILHLVAQGSLAADRRRYIRGFRRPASPRPKGESAGLRCKLGPVLVEGVGVVVLGRPHARDRHGELVELGRKSVIDHMTVPVPTRDNKKPACWGISGGRNLSLCIVMVPRSPSGRQAVDPPQLLKTGDKVNEFFLADRLAVDGDAIHRHQRAAA